MIEIQEENPKLINNNGIFLINQIIRILEENVFVKNGGCLNLNSIVTSLDHVFRYINVDDLMECIDYNFNHDSRSDLYKRISQNYKEIDLILFVLDWI